MKKNLVRILIGLAVLLVIAVVLASLFLDSIVKKGVETVAPSLTKTAVTLDGVKLSVLSGSGTVKGLFVGNPQGFKTDAAIRAGSISVGVRPMSVFGDKIHVTHLRMEAPEITLEGGLKDNNLNKILANVQAAAGGTNATQKAAEPAGASKKLQVDDFLITGAKVRVAVGPLAGSPATVVMPDIHFTSLGTGPDGITVGDLVSKIFGDIDKMSLQLAQKALADVGKVAGDAAKAAGDAASSAVGSAGKSVGDAVGGLFKKKKE